MKKLIILLLLIVAIGAEGQTTKIKSYLNDSISVVKGYRQLAPIIVTINGDTARSYLWTVSPISRDSTAITSIFLTLYDRNANPLVSKNIIISESTYNKWSGLFTAIDNYIHNQISRIVLH